jgi:hypothetical protein
VFCVYVWVYKSALGCAPAGDVSHEIGGEGLESRGEVKMEANVTFEGDGFCVDAVVGSHAGCSHSSSFNRPAEERRQTDVVAQQQLQIHQRSVVFVGFVCWQ